MMLKLTILELDWYEARDRYVNSEGFGEGWGKGDGIGIPMGNGGEGYYGKYIGHEGVFGESEAWLNGDGRSLRGEGFALTSGKGCVYDTVYIRRSIGNA